MRREISTLKGIGAQRVKAFKKAGIFTLFDLVCHFPRRYEDRRRVEAVKDLVWGDICLIEAVVANEVVVSHIRRELSIARVNVFDSTGMVKLTFFNQPYIRNSLKKGDTYRFYAKAEGSLLRPEMQNPIFERVGENRITGRIVPIYPLSAGLSQNIVSRYINEVLRDYPVEDWFYEYLQSETILEAGLMPVKLAVYAIHNPVSLKEAKEALERLAFDEMLTLMAGLALLKSRRNSMRFKPFEGLIAEEFYARLPFEPTKAQRRAVAEIFSDLTAGRKMNRLLQGDVGSGKTMVAAAAVWAAVKNGYQAAFMAPTSILAAQHYNDLMPFFEGFGINVHILTGAMTARERREILKEISACEPCLIIGTHALIQSGVEFSRLGLIICDEQHRFGVSQRAELTGKGDNPHLLAMSATPIPRTLSLVLYGDLDVSVLDELPPGRKIVSTYLVEETKRERAYKFIERHVGQGRQVYIVCPAVEENEIMSELKAATVYAENLRKRLPSLRIGLVHGRLAAAKKEAVMSAFCNGEIDVLVSTTVIEVGINVPNAVVMMVENADRFGLSQLHQLRGRVGRGEHQSYCILFSESKNETTLSRLRAFCATNDGFKIAEEDLKLRGPGDIFGREQHGVPALKAAGLVWDMRILDRARRVAEQMLEDDPALESQKNSAFREKVAELFKTGRNIDIFN